MRILRIGDPHIKPSNVEECEDLMFFINDKILELKPDRVEILGDLFHTHSIIRLEVLEFWDAWLDVLLGHEIDIYALIGNHDRATPHENSYSALHIFKHVARHNRNLKIVEYPRVDGIFAYVSWYNNPEVFIRVANDCAAQGAKVLVCHQTFDGSQYENGFFAPDGIDASKINFDLIISGHIHTTQDITKNGKRIIYPGTPKWDTISDANLDKGIWLFEHDDENGAISKLELIRTSEVVKPIISLTWKEGEAQPVISDRAHVTLELIGSSAWIESVKGDLKGKVAIKTKRMDKPDKKKRETGKNFPDFVVKTFETQLDKIVLLKYMKGLNIV